MARVLERSYASRGGVRRFFVNRALRIYPPYLAVLAVSVVAVMLLPNIARGLNPTLTLPGDGLGWLRNLIAFTTHVDFMHVPTLIPPAWSIDVELCLYLAIGLVLHRSVGMTAVATLACAIYTAALLAQGASFPDRYSNVAAGGLPFGIGALLYCGRGALTSALAPYLRIHLVLASSLFAGNALAPAVVPRGYAFYWGFYVSVAAVAYLVAALSSFDPRRAPRGLSRTDAFLGSLSYPLFLCHWQVAVTAIWLGVATGKGAALFLWCIPLATAAAWGVHRLVERPVETLRDRVHGTQL